MYKTLHNVRPLVFAAVCLGQAELGGAEPVKLRELTTDRPDATESPFTIDAGHVQLELDFANFTRDRENGGNTAEREVAPFNVRFGMTPHLELGFFVIPYRRIEETPAVGASRTFRGVGDLTLRAKGNFFGNDSGATALGLIVDLKVPTATRDVGNGAVEGAVLLPVSFALGHGWDLGAMTGVDLRLGDSGRGRRGVWINSVTTGHDLTQNISGYLELASEAGDGTHVATFDAGLTFRLDANTQFDVGAEFGIARAADDLHVFTGVSRKF